MLGMLQAVPLPPDPPVPLAFLRLTPAQPKSLVREPPSFPELLVIDSPRLRPPLPTELALASEDTVTVTTSMTPSRCLGPVSFFPPVSHQRQDTSPFTLLAGRMAKKSQIQKKELSH